MDLTMLTCASLPSRFVLRELEPSLRSAHLDVLKLHASITSVAEFTWVKAHFMLEKKKDVYKSSKNVYFVFRVLELGQQLLQHGRISDFTAANSWWDHVSELFERLSVRPGEWDLVEAALAHAVRAQFERFQQTWQRCLQACLPRNLLSSSVLLICEYLGTCPTPCRSPRNPPPQQPVCCFCWHPLREREATVVTLVQCQHRFHRECIAASVRSGKRATCCECQAPYHLAVDRESVVGRERGLRADPRPRFGGYPATFLLPHEHGDGEDLECFNVTSARSVLAQVTH
mmetsp:Transcript_42401/g.98199  ORF Transcript_42401/g.98199 Transcript_42401/m.98199 type:complete len:287 (-) Transcript_42401:86-946(-)